MESIKHFINTISSPKIMFTMILVVFFFIFPPNDWFYRVNRKLGYNNLWTRKGGIFIFLTLFLFFSFSCAFNDS